MAHSSALANLATEYADRNGRASFSELKKLASDYLESRKMSILDAAAIGIAFDFVFSADKVDLSQITPDMARAWDLAYPHVAIESLAGRSPAELGGIISGWKGKLFEVEVEQRLNAGEWVGDLHLEHDQVAVLADSPIQPGWDMQILNPDGSLADSIQLKATESISYVHEALARYPDTPVFATHEVASRMADDGIIDSGILNDHLTNGVSGQISDATSDAVSDSVMGAMPLSIIVATEAIKVMAGKKSIDDAFTSGGDRLVKGAIASGVAVAVSFVGTPILGAVAGFLTRLALGSEDTTMKSAPVFVPPNSLRMQGTLKQLSDDTLPIRGHYPCTFESSLGSRTPNLSDDEEILCLADDLTRLHIEQGSMPLASWIRMMLRKDMEEMSMPRLTRHMSNLRMIKSAQWVKRAFPTNGFFEALALEFKDEYRQLGADLDRALNAGLLLEKKLSGTFTEADEEALKDAKMTPDQRREHQSRKFKRRLIEKAIREHSIESAKKVWPEEFNADGTLRPL